MTTQAAIQLNYTDNEPIYRALLATKDPAERERIYREDLFGAYAGLFQMFGGSDVLQSAANWKLYTPDDYVGPARERIQHTVDGLAAADAFTSVHAAMTDATNAFIPHTDQIGLDSVQAGLFIGELDKAVAEQGYTGFGAMPGYVMVVYDMPNAYTLHRIKGATAHEFNHNVRFKVHPFNPMTTSVGEYMIAEGLAESFAAELYGADVVGYYVTDFDGSRFDETKAIIADALQVTGFDKIRGYIFGDRIAGQMGFAAVGVPDYAGYALGYHVVQAFTVRTGKSVVEATLLPADAIIRESGFFSA